MRQPSPASDRGVRQATPLLLGIAIICCATSPSLRAQEPAERKQTTWTVEAGIGFEYDTNVSVDEVDLSSGQSDYALTTDFQLSARHRFSERTQGNLTYDISQSSYREFSRVDRITQLLGADIGTQIGSASAGLSAYYVDSRLDGDAFLRFLRLSPALSGFISQRWFARAAYVYSQRDIDGRSQRNADTHAGEVDFYYFHRGLRSYANLGYRYRDEEAIADEFDFSAHSIKLRYIRRFELLGRQAKAEAAVRYELRDYRNDEPTIGEPRADDRLRWKLDLEVPLATHFTWQWYYSYGDYVSNLPRADFIQTIVGTRLQYRW